MNNTSLALIQPDELETIQRTGRMLAASGYFDTKGDSVQAIAQMATKILAGREMGIGPFASVNGIHIIQGKPTLGANLQASLVKSSGRYNYKVREMTDKVCRIEFFERNGDKWESIGISEFTKEDAAKAGTQNMTKFPRNMMFARAMSNGVKWYCPDVTNGNAVYVPEELGADVDEDGNVIEATGRVLPSVDTTTSENTSQQPAGTPEQGDNYHVVGDEIFGGATTELSESRLQFQALGQELFGAQWPVVSKRNVSRITEGVTKDANALTVEQLQRLIAGMTKVKEQRDTQQPEAQAA